MMEWDKLTNQTLYNWLTENYPNRKFELKEDNIICNMGKNVVCDYHVGMLKEKYEWWNSMILAHVGVMNNKGLQGSAGAVDNFEDLKKHVDDCFERGQAWINAQKSINAQGKKDIRRKLF